MKQLFTIALLGLINLALFAQDNSVLLVHETFNTEVNLETGYSVSPQSNSMVLDSSPGTYNNTPCLKSNAGLAYITFNTMSLQSNTDSIDFSFHSRRHIYQGSIELQISTDSIEWESLRVFNINSSTWVQYHHTQANWFQTFPSDSLYLRLKVDPSYTSNTSLYLDDFIATSYHSEPIPPPICDTLYVEVPIFITDSIPQSCMLDNNGDGIIGTQDLLGLLIYYGTYSNCVVQ